jgi:hypothetical protein
VSLFSISFSGSKKFCKWLSLAISL